MGKNLRFRISTDSIMGKYLGHSIYALFAFIIILYQYSSFDLLSLINSRGRPVYLYRLMTTGSSLVIRTNTVIQ